MQGRPLQTPLLLCGAILTQLTCHTLRMAEFEAELPRGGRFAWQPHGSHMAFHMANHVAFHVLSHMS